MATKRKNGNRDMGWFINMNHHTFWKLDLIKRARERLGLSKRDQDVMADMFDREIERLKSMLGPEMPLYKPKVPKNSESIPVTQRRITQRFGNAKGGPAVD